MTAGCTATIPNALRSATSLPAPRRLAPALVGLAVLAGLAAALAFAPDLTPDLTPVASLTAATLLDTGLAAGLAVLAAGFLEVFFSAVVVDFFAFAIDRLDTVASYQPSSPPGRSKICP